jgi:hypothetical protein
VYKCNVLKDLAFCEIPILLIEHLIQAYVYSTAIEPYIFFLSNFVYFSAPL